MRSANLIRQALLILFFVAVGHNSLFARTFDEIIAYVNDSVITKWELENVVKQRAMELQTAHQFSPREAMERAEQERQELLDRLIRQMLLVETALSLKIEVTDEEVEQYIQNFKKNAKIETEEEFIEQLKREGYTLSAFREQAKRNLMAERLLMQRVLPKLQVRDADVMKFFEENRQQFTTKTDEVHLKHIFIAFKASDAKRQAALKEMDSILNEIEMGKSFAELARRYTEDEQGQERAASKVGELIQWPIAEISNLSQPFRIALSTLNAGDLSDPIEGNDGIYLFNIESKTNQTISFRYLVIHLKPGEEAIEKANERANLVLQELRQGADFKTLVNQYTDDLETKSDGGNLGVRSLNDLNPNTRKVIEALAVGEYSAPLKTAHGLHIFTVDSRTAVELTEAEKEQIRLVLREQKFQEGWQAYTDTILKGAYVKINPIK